MIVSREGPAQRRVHAAQSLRRCLMQLRDEVQAHDFELCSLFLTLAIMDLAEQAPEPQAASTSEAA